MKIQLENAFGIKNKITIDSHNKKNIVIFGPNGVGKSSIAKIFRQVEKGNLEGFNLEKNGDSNSLLFDRKNMSEIKNSDMNIKIMDSSVSIKNIDDPIQKYIKSRKVDTKLDNLFNKLNSVFKKIREEHFRNIDLRFLDTEVQELFSENAFSIDNFKERLKTIKGLVKKAKSEIKNSGCSKEKVNEVRTRYHTIQEIQGKIGDTEDTEVSSLLKSLKEKVDNYDKNLKRAFPIIDRINEENMGDIFAYLQGETFIPIAEIYESLKKDNVKVDMPEEVKDKIIKNFEKLYNYLGDTSSSKDIITIGTIADRIESEFKNTQNNYILEVISGQDEIINVEKHSKQAIVEYIDDYNKVVQKVNGLIDSTNTQAWTLKVEDIKSISSPFKCSIKYNSKSYGKQARNNFSSTGQKKVIAIVLDLLNYKNYDLIIMDDIMTSLDSDNSEVIIELLKKIDKPIIFMTHNYSMLNRISNSVLSKECSLYVIDSIVDLKKENRSILFEVKEWKQVGKIHNTINVNKNNPVEEYLKISITSILSTVLYEFIQNYIQVDRPSEINEQISLDRVKKLINNSVRHWKEDGVSVLAFSKELLDCAEHIKEVVFGSSSVFKSLTKQTDEKSFVSYFEEKNCKNVTEWVVKEIDKLSFLNWIALKYLISMTIRHSAEKFVITNLNRSFPSVGYLNAWNMGKIKGLSQNALENCITKCFKDQPKVKEQKKALERVLKSSPFGLIMEINNRLHFLNHLDNLKWTPMFEFPLHKLLSYLKTLEIAIENYGDEEKRITDSLIKI